MTTVLIDVHATLSPEYMLDTATEAGLSDEAANMLRHFGKVPLTLAVDKATGIVQDYGLAEKFNAPPVPAPDYMSWQDYCDFTDETAVYPEAGTGSALEMAYVGLGLAGEMAEFLEAETAEEEWAELGDCFWYVARALKAISHALEEVAMEPLLPSRMLEDTLTNIMLIGNTTKKLLRDGMREDLLLDLNTKYCQAFTDLKGVVEEYGVPYEHVLAVNAAKLRARKAGGKLHGSGDNR